MIAIVEKIMILFKPFLLGKVKYYVNKENKN